jgi:hypothetical protein
VSYQVYITRAEFWAENEGSEISAGEWLELLRKDAEISQDEANGPYFGVLGGSQERAESWLDWSGGNLYTSYPNRPMQKKMLQIAGELGAVIQGDDGEIYASAEDFPESIDRRLAAAPAAPPREGLPAYKRREIIRQVIMYGVIAAVIIAVNVFDLW